MVSPRAWSFVALGGSPTARRHDGTESIVIGIASAPLRRQWKPQTKTAPLGRAGAGKRLGQIDSPAGPLGFRRLAAAAFTGKLFTNATASSSHALSAPFIGTGGSI